MEPRHYLLPVLLLLACDDDEGEPRPVVTPPSIDASADDSAQQPGIDASCETSLGIQDFDGDGFGRGEGDCDDCNRLRGPASLELPGNGSDDDCDGVVDELADSCDQELKDSETDPAKALRAFGLCGGPATTRNVGLVNASFSRLSGKAGLGDERQLWLPEKFGTIPPREGARLLVLSTGVARDVNDDGYTKACDVFGSTLGMDGSWSGGAAPPTGFPRDAKACGKDPVSEGALAFDSVVLDLTVRAPNNVSAFAFDSLFLSYEYPDFVCSRYNDFFVVLMDPAPTQADDDDNILFDSDDDPVGVNSGLLSVCRETSRAARKIACSAGPALLKDTGFDRYESVCAPLAAGEQNLGGASTGWLHTEMPVAPGNTFKLRFVLWDSGDPLLDSTVLLDNFRFLDAVPSGGTTPITSG